MRAEERWWVIRESGSLTTEVRKSSKAGLGEAKHLGLLFIINVDVFMGVALTRVSAVHWLTATKQGKFSGRYDSITSLGVPEALLLAD